MEFPCITPPDGLTLDEVESLARQLLGTIVARRGVDSQAPSYTVGEAVADVLVEVEAHNRETTLRQYTMNARRFTARFGLFRPLGSIGVEDLQRYQNDRLREAAPATVVQEQAFLSRLFDSAKRRGMVSHNPVAKLVKFKVDNQRDTWIDDQQEARLLDELAHRWPEEPWNSDIVRLAALTGMRRMEMFELTRDQVHLDRRQLCLVRSKTGRRWVTLSQAACVVLQSLMSRHSEAHVIQAMNCQSRYCTGTSWYQNRFRVAANAIGLKNVRLHDLRHTFASRLVNKGAQLYDVAALLGHHDVSMTQRYSHLSSARLRSVVDMLGGAQ